MIDLQKLIDLEHTFSTEQDYVNPIKQIQLSTKCYEALSPQLDGKYSKSMPTFWGSSVYEQWEDMEDNEDTCDVLVVRKQGVEKYNELEINLRKSDMRYED